MSGNLSISPTSSISPRMNSPMQGDEHTRRLNIMGRISPNTLATSPTSSKSPMARSPMSKSPISSTSPLRYSRPTSNLSPSSHNTQSSPTISRNQKITPAQTSSTTPTNEKKEEEETAISSIFKGKLKSNIKCLRCKNVIPSPSPFLQFSRNLLKGFGNPYQNLCDIRP